VRKASRVISVLNISSVNIVGLTILISNKCESTDLGYSCVKICTSLNHSSLSQSRSCFGSCDPSNWNELHLVHHNGKVCFAHWQYRREFVFQCSFYFSLHQELTVCSLQVDHTTSTVNLHHLVLTDGPAWFIILRISTHVLLKLSCRVSSVSEVQRCVVLRLCSTCH